MKGIKERHKTLGDIEVLMKMQHRSGNYLSLCKTYTVYKPDAYTSLSVSKKPQFYMLYSSDDNISSSSVVRFEYKDGRSVIFSTAIKRYFKAVDTLDYVKFTKHN